MNLWNIKKLLKRLLDNFSLSCILVIYFILTILLVYNCNSQKTKSQSQRNYDKKKLHSILEEWSSSYIKKIDKDYSISVNFVTSDKDITYNITIKDQNYFIKDSIDTKASFTFKSTIAHYNKIFRGEMTAFTSIGRSKMSDSTPLDINFNQTMSADLMNDFLFFVQRFFNKTAYDKVILDKEHSRIVHGAHAIPIFYRKNKNLGVRSAWYQIEKGQQVNEPGGTNPFPQYFIITKGRGYAKIGADTIKVKKDEAYYIAPGADHVFWTDSQNPMELIFLAWGKGA